MTDKTLFQKIVDREIPADIVYEDDEVIAIRDINPQAPMHVLVCPKQPIPMVSAAQAGDAALLGKLLLRAGEIATAEGYGDRFRLVVNNGAAVGQTVFHLHVHVLGGRSFTWPPG